MSVTRELHDRTAVIFGAGRGIGRAIAHHFASAGAQLLLSARTVPEIDRVAQECRERGAIAHAIAADIASSSDVHVVKREAVSRLGHIDVLVNCAGIYGPIGLVETNDAAAWVRAVEVNLIGVFHLAAAFLPHFKQRRAGKIILLGGGGAAAPLPHFSAYAASKAGVARLADTLAEELKPFDVQVNVVAPGLVDTSLQDDVLAAGERAGPLLEKIRQAREQGKGSVAPDVAATLAVFLASSRSGALTGKLIAAPHDPWREWTAARLDALNASSLYAIRRIDPFTVKPLIQDLS